MGTWPPLARFSVLQAVATTAVTGSAWFLASLGALEWFPGNETGMMTLAVLLSGVAAHLANLRLPAQAIAAAVIASLLQMLIYYLPLLILLDARPNLILNRGMVKVFLQLLFVYGAVIGITLVVKSLLKTRATGQ